eukprot:jgi/Undpi1/10306/HiC_scaffold_28.g12757.m1
MREQEWGESWRNDALGEGLLKQYSSFAKYALEGSKSTSSLPVPLVKPIGQKSAVSIPIITIIGVQKGGTTSLRGNMLTHPMVWGMQNEVHFFDLMPSRYPKLGDWEGDGLEHDLGIGAAGRILSEYAKACVKEGDAGYRPYTAICRGENASTSDLWTCYQALKAYNPLYRGLYADQLERWFRVFHRSQILAIDSAEMFKDFTAVVAAVAEFAGLPEHDFKYDSSHEFKGGCPKRSRRHGLDFFADGGRYSTMIEEEELFREWYRPHNERLYKLLGRDLMWR